MSRVWHVPLPTSVPPEERSRYLSPRMAVAYKGVRIVFPDKEIPFLALMLGDTYNLITSAIGKGWTGPYYTTTRMYYAEKPNYNMISIV